MRVFQVASGLHDWGGIERYVLYLAEGLEERGHRVEVACPPNSPLAEKLPRSIPLNCRGKHDLRAFAAYLRLFKTQRYDVVHVHFNPDFLAAGVAARLRRQPRTILTRHVALPWSKAKVRLYRPLFDHIIPVSNAVERILAESGIPREMMTVAKAGSPEIHASGTQSLQIDASKFNVGSFGRLSQEKGLDLIFQAAMMERASGVAFHVFGSGPLLDSYKELGIQTGVRVHGFRTDVADCMSAMDAVVIPSRWEEAFPYAALEAMSLGKPLIVSNVGGLVEMVEHGITGLHFERERADALASAAAELSGDRARAASMGSAARELHGRQYTVPAMAQRIEAVYQSIASKSR